MQNQHSSACFLNMGEKTCEIDHSFHSTSLMIPNQWLEASFQTERYRNGRRFFLIYFSPILLGWSFFSHHINNSKKLGKLYTYKWTPKWHSLINQPMGLQIVVIYEQQFRIINWTLNTIWFQLTIFCPEWVLRVFKPRCDPWIY